MVNSGPFDGQPSGEAWQGIAAMMGRLAMAGGSSSTGCVTG